MRAAWAMVLILAGMVCATIGAIVTPAVTPTAVPVQATPTDLPTPALKVCLVNTGLDSGALTLRSGPGVNYTALTWILERQPVEIIRSGRGWVQVKYGKLIGWVNKTYLECGR